MTTEQAVKTIREMANEPRRVTSVPVPPLTGDHATDLAMAVRHTVTEFDGALRRLARG